MMSTGEQQQHESSSLPQSQQGSGTMDTKKLEGTLICRIKGKMKKMRMVRYLFILRDHMILFILMLFLFAQWK